MNHTTMTPNMIMQKSVNWYGVVYRGTRDRNNQRILTGNRYYFVTKILCYLKKCAGSEQSQNNLIFSGSRGLQKCNAVLCKDLEATRLI